MKMTNKHGLPRSMVAALSNDDYDPGESDITATGILKPPQMVALERLHHDDLVSDVMDRVWSLSGRAKHYILERIDVPDVIREQRYYGDFFGWHVGGQIDLYEIPEKRLIDYKETSVWAVIYGKGEWAQQLNIQKLLMEENGFQVADLNILTILKDWKKREAQQKGGDYPKNPIMMVPQPIWTREETLEFMEERLARHQVARINVAAGRPLPECTPEERWYSGETYAVMKGTNKRATRVFDDRQPAEKFASEKGDDHRVVMRPGINKRCEEYCPVADFCNQFKKIKEQSHG